ncbi:MAG TPA: 5-deoxy-glucuronate isomerase [Blastocatellia bacterium]|nr:5-deoxy-glucuronate isomerase [Blastocatellia bacterium]
MEIVKHPITAEGCVVRGTNKIKGRTRSVAPGPTAARHLHYGRIILDAGDDAIRFQTGEHETSLICLKGRATVRVEDNSFELGRYDSLYIPRDSEVEVAATSEGCDIAEISAPVEKHYPLQMISFADVQKDSALHFKTGSPSAERELNILIGKNVEAGRLLAGVTFSKPGNWTSWPPHEHAAMLEEAYLYIDMPAPAWGIQLVYTDPQQPELAVVVREGDMVIMPQGYHPNVAASGGQINFLWMMAAAREGEDRQFGVVNVQPEYAAGGSGLEAARTGR